MIKYVDAPSESSKGRCNGVDRYGQRLFGFGFSLERTN